MRSWIAVLTVAAVVLTFLVFALARPGPTLDELDEEEDAAGPYDGDIDLRR